MTDLVIFDVDNTIAKGYIQKKFLDYLYKNKKITINYYLKISFWFLLYKFGLIHNPKDIMEYAYSFLKDKYVEDFNKIIKDFLKNNFKKLFYEEAKKLIETFKKEGKKIIVISTLPEPILKQIAECFKIDYYIGTKLETNNLRYTGKIIGNIVYGKEKLSSVKKFISENNLNPEKIWSYADHISDFDLLEIANYPFVVNPNRLSKREALRKNWQVIIFKN